MAESIYKRVYFRINTPSYRTNGIGFQDQAEERFDDEAVNVFLNNGWDVKVKRTGNGRCSRVTKDKQELYLHPDHFSGVVLEDNIPHIEEMIKSGILFEPRWTDVYDEVFDMTDEEYMKLLQSKRSEIEHDLLGKFQTKRSNLYITSSWSVCDGVLSKHRIKRLTSYVGVYSSSDPDCKFVAKVFEDLVDAGKIVTANTKNGTGYRTNKKLLQKATA